MPGSLQVCGCPSARAAPMNVRHVPAAALWATQAQHASQRQCVRQARQRCQMRAKPPCEYSGTGVHAICVRRRRKRRAPTRNRAARAGAARVDNATPGRTRPARRPLAAIDHLPERASGGHPVLKVRSAARPASGCLVRAACQHCRQHDHLTITDGQLGDDDLTANGTIVDQGGPGSSGTGSGGGGTATVTPVPTLSQWAMILLSMLLAVIAMRNLARRR